MKEKITLAGRSGAINALLIIANLTGLVFLVLGNHEAFESQSMLYNGLGIGLMVISIAGLILFKGRLMMSSVSRVLVGGLFIVSGLVKANDPVGFSYKLEEYFEDGALAYRIKELFGAPGFSMEWLMDYALALSIIICIVEIVLGVFTLIGGKLKLASYMMLLMMLFFTFLTWHTANCDSEEKFLDRDTYEMTDPLAALKIEEAKTNKEITIYKQTSSELVVDEMKKPQCVDDCGCFGDALKGSVGRSLTPNESFWKDLILVYLVLWIFLAQWITKPNSGRENVVYSAAGLVVVVFFSWVFGWYFPILFTAVVIIAALWVKRAGGKVLGNLYGSTLLVIAFCTSLVVYVLAYVPLKDYRPYSVGSDLKAKMNDGIDGEYENMLVYKNKSTGETKEFSATSQEYVDSKIWEDKDWEYKENIQKTIVPAKNPSIMDFNPTISMEDLGDDEREFEYVKNVLDTSVVQVLKILSLEYDSEMETPIEEYDPAGFPEEEYKILDTMTSVDPNLTEFAIKDALINDDRTVFVVSRKLSEANWGVIKDLKDIQKACKELEVPFFMICNATRDEINAFKQKHSFNVPVFSMDEIELKIISRSNPALMVLEKGVVKGKYAYRSLPSGENFKSDHLD